MNACVLCDGACSGADLGPLLDVRLGWLWEQIGRAADRRGDAALMEGSLSLRAPSIRLSVPLPRGWLAGES